MDTGKIDEAATWLVTGELDRARAAVPQLQERFGLTAKQACDAIRTANLIRARAS